jgi:hypothetical protein
MHVVARTAGRLAAIGSQTGDAIRPSGSTAVGYFNPSVMSFASLSPPVFLGGVRVALQPVEETGETGFMCPQIRTLSWPSLSTGR